MVKNSDDDVLIKVDNVSKKFCRDFKKSLWYGVKDTAADLFRISGKEGKVCSEERNLPAVDAGGDRVPQGSPTPSSHLRSPSEADFSPLPHSEFPDPTSLPKLREGEFWANQNISFQVRRGECLGLIGHNGAGKTTLLKMLNGLIKPDTGSITMKGRVAALIALGAGFNPILTGRENIYVNGSILGLNRKEIDAKLEEIIDYAEIEEAIDAPVRTYSSGMQVRLGFSVAVVLVKPEILILDEVLAVGDLSFRAKCRHTIRSASETTATILVTHNMIDLHQSCSKAILLQKGKIILSGSTSKAESEFIALQPKPTSQKTGSYSMEPAYHTSISLQSFKDNSLSLQLEVDLARKTECTLTLTLFAADGTIVGEATSDHIILNRGENQLEVELEAKLGNGKYYVGHDISSSTTNTIFAGSRRILSFISNGAILNKGNYAPPLKILTHTKIDL